MYTPNKSVIDKEELEKIQKESKRQERPDQKTVISVSAKLRKRLHDLPDPTNPPLGYDDHKAFDRVFLYINIPALHPKNHGDTVNTQSNSDYSEGHFAEDKDYVLAREKKKNKKHGEIFEAILKARHKFEKEGEYIVACKVQDNLAGETILNRKIEVNN